MNLYFSSTFVLIRREWKRFFRQRSRVFSALFTPILFWIMMGLGFGQSIEMPFSSSGYLEYFFPGFLVMTLLFSSIFSMISLIEDRNEGFLQSVMVSPASHSSIVFGKILGSASLSTFQVMLVVPLAYFAGIDLTASSFPKLLISFFVIGLFLCSLSFFFAWILNSSQGFHAVMNILLFPMWILSGALFPLQGSSPVIQWIMKLNPMTYSLNIVRNILYHGADMAPNPGLGSFTWLVVLCLGLLFLDFFLVKKSYQ